MSVLSCILPYSSNLHLSLGLAEIEEGEVEGHKIHLVSHTVGRTSFNKDPKVIKVGTLFASP